MFRVRFHGRGGQGMKTASRILGSVAFHAGYIVQDSPIYGAERRSAPMSAFVRITHQPHNYAQLAVETGVFTLKKATNGVVTHTYVPRRKIAVVDYLRGQGCYRHLFEPVHNDEVISRIQHQVDATGQTCTKRQVQPGRRSVPGLVFSYKVGSLRFARTHNFLCH